MLDACDTLDGAGRRHGEQLAGLHHAARQAEAGRAGLRGGQDADLPRRRPGRGDRQHLRAPARRTRAAGRSTRHGCGMRASPAAPARSTATRRRRPTSTAAGASGTSAASTPPSCRTSANASNGALNFASLGGGAIPLLFATPPILPAPTANDGLANLIMNYRLRHARGEHLRHQRRVPGVGHRAAQRRRHRPVAVQAAAAAS